MTAKEKTFIFDVEGTLSDHRHRLHHIPRDVPYENVDWREFQSRFKHDTPNIHVVNLARVLAQSASIVISTGMPAHMRDELMKWLGKNRVEVDLVLMREVHHGNVGSPELKISHFYEMISLGHRPVAIFDDRHDVCEALHKKGLETFHLPFKGSY